MDKDRVKYNTKYIIGKSWDDVEKAWTSSSMRYDTPDEAEFVLEKMKAHEPKIFMDHKVYQMNVSFVVYCKDWD